MLTMDQTRPEEKFYFTSYKELSRNRSCYSPEIQHSQKHFGDYRKTKFWFGEMLNRIVAAVLQSSITSRTKCRIHRGVPISLIKNAILQNSVGLQRVVLNWFIWIYMQIIIVTGWPTIGAGQWDLSPLFVVCFYWWMRSGFFAFRSLSYIGMFLLLFMTSRTFLSSSSMMVSHSAPESCDSKLSVECPSVAGGADCVVFLSCPIRPYWTSFSSISSIDGKTVFSFMVRLRNTSLRFLTTFCWATF
jgi:hypothetical protein